MFPLHEHEIDILESLKHRLATPTMQPIDENIPFTVEIDDFDFAI